MGVGIRGRRADASAGGTRDWVGATNDCGSVDGYAVFQIKSTPNGNDLTVTRTLARAFTLLQPDEYSPMREFYRKVNVADQQQILLSNSTSALKVPNRKPSGNFALKT